MSRTRSGRIGSATLGWVGLLVNLVAALPLMAQPPPRYRPKVGDRLVYERRVQIAPLAGDGAAREYTQQVQLWILGGDQKEVQVLGDLVRVTDQQPNLVRGTLFHMDARGRRSFSGEALARLAGLDPVFDVIPILPTALEDNSEWLTDPDHFGRRWRSTRGEPDPAVAGAVRVDFVLEDPTGVSETLGQSQQGSYWFDRRAGVVVRVESEWRDQAAGQRTLSVTRLHTSLKRKPRWCEQRIEEIEPFLCTLRLEDRLLDQMTSEPDKLEWIISNADRLWSELILDTAREPQSPIRRLAEGRRALFANDRNKHREREELARQWLGSTAAQWSLQTPDGETVRSETLRDRIVVECFWRADSLWSLRSFEILRALQEQLSPESYRVVCLNIDADAAAGRRAARLCGTGLTHILAGPPLAGLPPRELPIFRVLDAGSKVLAVYFGWQPGLAEKVRSLGD